ncbi:hypothetical protein G9A89_001059 [Geosiphon pyriformis]|nr:hypothetical protein G9A89_001059 [Geosiphon pyriformis]
MFKQIQAEDKSATAVFFANSFPVHIKVNFLNNFLANVVHIFSKCGLSLEVPMANAFKFRNRTLMSFVLGDSNYFQYLLSFQCYEIAFFKMSVHFLCGVIPFSSHKFKIVCDSLLAYTDGFLSSLRTLNIKTGATAIALALECVLSFHLIDLYSNSQTALDSCRSELNMAYSDFRNHCWIKCHHIVRSYLGVLDNEHANMLAKAAALSSWHLLYLVSEYYVRADDNTVSSNFRHFIHEVFHSVYCAYWEVGFGSWVVLNNLCVNIDWFKSSLVWYPDSYMAAGITSKSSAGFCTYLIKALYHWLLVTLHKWLYNKCYFSIVCLFYDKVKVSDHAFFCAFNAVDYAQLLNTYVTAWKALSGLHYSASCVLQLLFVCVSDSVIKVALCKGFVFNNWYYKSVSVFKDSKVASHNIVDFVHRFCLAFFFMEKNRLISHDRSIPISVFGFLLVLLAGMVRLLGVAKAIGIEDKVSVYISV